MIKSQIDALADVLAPFSDHIAKVAGTVTCIQFLSGIFLLNDVRKSGSSDTHSPDPFIGGVVLTILSLKLGSLMGDNAMTNVNMFGFAINIAFMLVFYSYATTTYKTKIWAKICLAAIFTMGCLAYSNYEDVDKIEFRLGILITTLLVILVGAPLLNLGNILKKQSVEGLPFPFILSGTIVAASWLLYGISIRNDMVAYQNLILFTLSFAQLVLFAIFPNKSEEGSSLSLGLRSKPSKINSSRTSSASSIAF